MSLFCAGLLPLLEDTVQHIRPVGRPMQTVPEDCVRQVLYESELSLPPLGTFSGRVSNSSPISPHLDANSPGTL